MEPVLIVTDTSYTDVKAVQSFDMDLAYGTDEQDFEVSFEEPVLTGGELIYIDGTAYGGVVDVIESDTESTVTVYRGRTWHGILSGKIIAPPYNQDYVRFSGDANQVIADVLSRVGLTDIMAANPVASGITITNGRIRFANAYDGLVQMLSSAGAKLMMQHRNGKTYLWAEPVRTISHEADSDLMQFILSANHRVPNHLVCAGTGEMEERIRLDLYADADGNISETQTFFGVDEIAIFYDYTNADMDTLRADGTKTLKEFQVQGNIDADVAGVGDWDVGDLLVARDNRLGRTVTARIVKKIVRVQRGALTTEYEVGLPVSTASRISNTGESTGAYAAGDGIDITDGTITATGQFSGDISAAGAISAASADISGALSFGGNLTVGGDTFTNAGVADGLRVHTNAASAWVNADTYAAASRLFTVGAVVDNSASAYDGRNASLYVTTNGMNSYIGGTSSKAAVAPWNLVLPSGTTNLTLQTTSLNLTTTNIGGGTKTVYFAKFGPIVIATFTGAMSPTAANTAYTIGTIPSGYRPARAAHASVRGKTNNIVSTASAAAKFVFNTGGSIQVRIGATGAYDYDFTTMWWTS